MNLAEHNRIAEALAPEAARYRGGVIVIHGMNTWAPWQHDLVEPFQDAGVKYLPVNYGRMIVRVLFKGTQDRLAKKIVDAYQRIRSWKVTPGAIAHSFGTRVLGSALENNPDLKLGRVVLFGGVLPRDFDWAGLQGRKQVNEVLNETCPRDPWPRRAKFLIPGTGPSGCCGFATAISGVTNRSYGHTKHSKLATPLHCSDTWIPFILEGALPKPGLSIGCGAKRCLREKG